MGRSCLDVKMIGKMLAVWCRATSPLGSGGGSRNAIPSHLPDMLHPIHSLIESRAATLHYDPARELSEQQIMELVRLATCAPSAYNLQNWRFIAVRSREAKACLKAAAFGQQKVVEAAVTFIICGRLNTHDELPHLLRPAVEAAILPDPVARDWVAMAERDYRDNLPLQRDEAIRSASLAAMTLMLAAQGMGLSTTPLGGFDGEAVSRQFGLTDNELPVILVCVGYGSVGNLPQKPRRALDDVMSYA